MSVRAKSRKRLTVVLAALVVIGCAGGGAYLIRMRQIERRVQRARDEGLQALAAGRYFDAMQEIGTYVQRHGDDADALYKYGIAREHVEEANGKHLIGATSFYVRALNLQPDNDQVRRALMDLYLRIGFNAEALNTANVRLNKASKDIDGLRAKAIALYRLRRPDESLQAATAYNELMPRDFEIQSLTLDLLSRKGRTPQDLLKYARELSTRYPTDPQLMLLQAVAYAIAGDSENYVAWLKKAASAAPLSDSTFLLAVVGQLDRAALSAESLALLNKAGGLNGDRAVRRMFVSRLWQAGHAQELIERLTDLDPSDRTTDSELLGMRAMALLSIGRRGEAESLLGALRARKNDEFAAAWASALSVLYANPPADDKQTVSTCRAALLIAPGNPYYHFALAEAYERTGDLETAIARFKSASDLAPQWVAPLARMAQALTRVGRPGEAVNAAKLARQRDPEDPRGSITLAVTVDPLVHANDQNAAELLRLVEDVQKRVPFEDQTLPIQVRLLALTGKQDEAKSRLRLSLDSTHLPTEATLLRLAGISQRAQLGLDELCFDRAEKKYGLTPDLALAKGKWYFDAGKPEEGLRILDAARSTHAVGDLIQWRTAWARYLDVMQDNRAAAAWKTLGNERPSDVQVQWFVLGSRAVQSDHEFVGQTIQRLRTLVGDEGLTLKLARAQWFLQGNGGEKETVEASVLLNEVMRTAPDLVAARRMLATCFERLGNTAAAVEQLKVALTLSPASNDIALELASDLNAQRSFTEARSILDNLRKKTLTTVERQKVADLLNQQGDFTAALNLLDSSPDQRDTPTLLQARLLRQTGRYELAEKVYRQLLAKPDPQVIDSAMDFYFSIHRPADAEKLLALLDSSQGPLGSKEMVQANFYRRSGETEKALGSYRAAVQKDPTNATAWRTLVDYCILLGRGQAAIDAASQAASLHPQVRGFQSIVGSAPAVLALSGDPTVRPILMEMTNAPDDALADIALVAKTLSDAKGKKLPLDKVVGPIREIADRRPAVLSVQFFLIAAYTDLHRPDDVFTMGSRAVQLFPAAAEPPHLAAAGLAALADPNPSTADPKRWSDVEVFARKWRDNSPGDAMAADLLIAESYLSRNQPQRAAEILRPYLPVVVADPDAQANFTVLAAFASGNVRAFPPAETAKLLEPLLARSSNSRGLWVVLATNLIGDRKISADWLHRVTQFVPADSLSESASLALSWRRISRDSPQFATDAQTALLHAISLSAAATTKDFADLLALARIQEELSDWNGAAAMYHHAVLVGAPDSLPQAAQLAAGLQRVAGHVPQLLIDARAALDRAVALSPSAASRDLDALLAVAYLQEQFKDWIGAEASYRRALQLDSHNLLCHNNLAMAIVRRNGNLAEAERLITTAIAEHPADPRLANCYDTLATIQAAARKYPAAMTSMNSALQLRPESIVFQIHMASHLVAGGQPAKARPILEKIDSDRGNPSTNDPEVSQELKNLRAALGMG